MLQHRSYPELVAKALVLENEPFETMVDDDAPWLEGLVLVAVVSLAGGVAVAMGNFLAALALPDPHAMWTLLLQGWRQLAANTGLAGAGGERIVADLWAWVAWSSGYAGGWSSLLPILSVPALALCWWLFYGFSAYAVGRGFGGRGTLTATLGATALTVAPLSLLLLSLVPFAGAGSPLLAVWTLLVGYRAVQVAHELDWRSAALTTLVIYGLGGAAGGLAGIAFVVGYWTGGA
jgi:hypothetical protein